jgi:hypothetical protein
MKKILLVIVLMTSFLSQAQTEWSEDSLDLINCKIIIRDLLEGKLIKDGNIQQSHLPIHYYWCKSCDGSLDCCNPFEKTYKKYLDKELRNNMNSGDLLMYTKQVDDEKRIMLHWTWFDMNDGSYENLYFEFDIVGKNPLRLILIEKLPSVYWDGE